MYPPFIKQCDIQTLQKQIVGRNLQCISTFCGLNYCKISKDHIYPSVPTRILTDIKDNIQTVVTSINYDRFVNLGSTTKEETFTKFDLDSTFDRANYNL